MTVRRYDHEGRLIEEDHTEVQPQPAAEESLESLLHRTEAELKGHFPMMVDSATRLDAVTAGTDRLHYHYTLLNAAAADLDVDATRTALTPLVQEQARNMSFLKLLMDKGATVTFHYQDQAGTEICAIEVKADTLA
ncbi:MAG: hypothetical protein MUE94_04275 [Verrucomicrobia bacterium]|jgi:hypothetical protein|nr:hypothetical protein [Verrucomicrobiota bacterium]